LNLSSLIGKLANWRIGKLTTIVVSLPASGRDAESAYEKKGAKKLPS